MALSPEELSRRMRAARLLRGQGRDGHGELAEVSRDELGEAVARRKGTGTSDPARIEREKLQALPLHLEAFQEVLRMPDGWWTEPDLDQVLGVNTPAEVEGPGRGPVISETEDAPTNPKADAPKQPKATPRRSQPKP